MSDSDEFAFGKQYNSDDEDDTQNLERDLDRVERTVRSVAQSYEDEEIGDLEEQELLEIVRTAVNAVSQVTSFSIVNRRSGEIPIDNSDRYVDPIISQASVDYMITLTKRTLSALEKWKQLL